ncbi:MAG: 4Fe-4S binding protein [Alphaproteobacteria bacterium]|nr:4Fe-4S binding protein [Alphaproteobacteria bacterium]
MRAPFSDPPLDAFLLDPLFFILGIYIAITLFVLGRGVFCGWLCPFGALQELSNKAVVLLRVPQFRVPRAVQEKLWAVKYLAAVAILGVGLYSIDMANQLEEIEPFKTAINVYFLRELPFVLYAVALLAAGLFIERFYCRFLCPLGGALAVAGRVPMFQWLKRRPQCGAQCRICEADCPVGAIDPSGHINMNECLQCLDCQVDYYDANKCPPLIARKKRKEARAQEGLSLQPQLAAVKADV